MVRVMSWRPVEGRSTEGRGRLVAWLTIQVSGIEVDGVAAFLDAKGVVFLKWPSKKGSDGRWYPLVRLVDDDLAAVAVQAARDFLRGVGVQGVATPDRRATTLRVVGDGGGRR